jgi:SAM-dependent methyltransferase
MEPDQVKTIVRGRYARAAREEKGCCNDPGALGYAPADLAGLPGEATGVSLGCGSPVAEAGLRPGERVLDLGSGAGLDVLLAARAVGERGHVYGVDMTPEMLARSRAAAAKAGAANVTILEGEIESLPLPDASVDVVISNCVINLSPDKARVFREAFRVLAPGGRFVVADMLSSAPLPASVREDASAWSECIAGAIPEEEYAGALAAAGFERVVVARAVRSGDACCAPEAGSCCGPEGSPPPQVFSATITARKPA